MVERERDPSVRVQILQRIRSAEARILGLLAEERLRVRSANLILEKLLEELEKK
jgi:hypothetical protein